MTTVEFASHKTGFIFDQMWRATIFFQIGVMVSVAVRNYELHFPVFFSKCYLEVLVSCWATQQSGSAKHCRLCDLISKFYMLPQFEASS